MPGHSWPMRIALVAPPMLPIPPRGYAGTERVIDVLADELHRRGHAVTLFAAGDSRVDCELVPTVDRALWERADAQDSPEELEPFFQVTQTRAWREHERFDVIHSHLEGFGFLFARHCPTPVVTTLHGRLDLPGMPEMIAEYSEVPLVSISDNQRRWFPDANWVATVHHGLPLEAITHSDRPGPYLALVGRISHEKGIAEAVELARETGLPLRVAAKQRRADERQLYHDVLDPAVREGVAEYLGEVGPPERDALYAGALATLMLGAWPEPFGLVAIESMAAGTPVIARKAGALPEIVEHGVDGFLVDDLREAKLAIERAAGLDRRRIRQRALARFSPGRMVDAYERVYRRVIEERRGRREGSARTHPTGVAAGPDMAAIDDRGKGDGVRQDLGGAGRRNGRTRTVLPVGPGLVQAHDLVSPPSLAWPAAAPLHPTEWPEAPLPAGALGRRPGGEARAAERGTSRWSAGGEERRERGMMAEANETRAQRTGSGRPIAWRAVESGTPVTGADGNRIGTLSEVVADDDEDIFHGIAVEAAGRVVLVDQRHVCRIGDVGVDTDLSDDDVASLPTFDREQGQPL
jgi:glycosyltransferase involved in cell wall biosynthesis